ncbi:MAG: ferrous iron transport protein B [Erysipelotrichaceae bacterium]|nr:ferrous iron transport protein B [Erysipelotrichaceae bacterium]
MIFALAGNQNSGKTTLFNALTGSNQHVGNFPGVTVEQKVGVVKQLPECQIVDLPGIYSIRPYTSEEIVSRDFIIKNNPDAIINIVDATNIERNLYLSLQLIELRVPMVIALNMMDELRANGGTVNIEKLQEYLGVPVVPISAIKEDGIDELIHIVEKTAANHVIPKVYDFCSPGPVHRCIHSVSHIVEDHADRAHISARFCAMQAILGDQEIIEKLHLDENELETIQHSIKQMEDERGLDVDAAIADMRYNFIEKVCKETVSKPVLSKERIRSEKIDRILTNKYLAIPIFVLIMMGVFIITFGGIGTWLSDLLAAVIDSFTETVSIALENYGINPVVHSLLIDGIFAGVGSVLSFLPIIVVLFFFLSILEDTGYMARVAFVMDKLLRKIGLSGKSIVPMLIGFGCSVPAVMSTRTLSSERDRRMTIMLTPFMSCSAKIPIYAMFTAAFFQKYKGLVMTALYFNGILVAVIVALILNNTVFTGKPIPFVMELPNYRMPSMKSCLLLMWDKAKDFLQRAFSIIFVATVIIWFLQSFDTRINVVEDASMSMLASLGKLLEPIFRPLGFGDWRAATALVTGFTAKEAVVSTLGVLMGTSEEELASVLSTMFTPVTAVSFLVFTLLYTPCVAAVAAIRREVGSRAQTLAIVLLQCVIAWICSFAVYRLGLLL